MAINNKILWHPEEFLKKAKRLSQQAAIKGGGHVLKHAISSMPFSDEVSDPEEPPLSKTGDLVASGKVNKLDKDFGAEVEFSESYAKWLEFGTKKMERRPFLLPALYRSADKILEEFKKKFS